MGKNLEPQYAFRCDELTIKKLEYIAKENTRTRNQEMKHIIKDYIAQYEKEYGEIKIENTITTYESLMSEKTITELYNRYDIFHDEISKEEFSEYLKKCSKIKNNDIIINQEKLTRYIKDSYYEKTKDKFQIENSKK